MLALFSFSTILFREDFTNGFSKWVHSHWHNHSARFVLGKGQYYGDEQESVALMTNESGRFYTATAPMEFTNAGKPLLFQFTVKHEQGIDCGGAYVKLYPPLEDGLDTVQGGVNETGYNIMFGPDICGSTKKLHFILNHNQSNVERRTPMECPHDKFTHLYMFGIYPDGTYFASVDGVLKAHGTLMQDWDFLAPASIPDPTAAKPVDWVDEAEMDDPSSVKPEGWDDVPQQIPDPHATVPDDWDTEDDGEWEAPLIANPEYKGTWKAQRISNPDYKGPWRSPMIDNPNYVYDDSMGNYTFGAIGFEIWQVKAGSAFDSILVCDSEDEMYEMGNRSMTLIAQEKDMFEAKQKAENQDDEKHEEDAEQKEKDEL